MVRHGDRTPYTRTNYLKSVCVLNYVAHGVCLMGSASQVLPNVDASEFWAGKLVDPARKAYLMARYPPSAPIKDAESGVFAQLTSIGADQAVAAGARLRSRYVESFRLLPASLQPSMMKVRSSNKGRTVRGAVGSLCACAIAAMQL